MTSVAFLFGWLRRSAHCDFYMHDPHNRRIGDRVIALECKDCGKVFWKKREWMAGTLPNGLPS
jgi:uncharacterized protein with PIN domain